MKAQENIVLKMMKRCSKQGALKNCIPFVWLPLVKVGTSIFLICLQLHNSGFDLEFEAPFTRQHFVVTRMVGHLDTWVGVVKNLRNVLADSLFELGHQTIWFNQTLIQSINRLTRNNTEGTLRTLWGVLRSKNQNIVFSFTPQFREV